MIQCLASFIVGILLILHLPVLPQIGWMIAGVAAAFFLSARRDNWILVFFFIGMAWASYTSIERLNSQLSPKLQGIDIELEGKINGLPQKDERKVRFDFSILESSQIEKKLLPEKIRLSWYFPEQNITAGQYWRFTVRLKRPHGAMNPGGFDYERWLLVRNIGATGYVRKFPQPVLLGRQTLWQSISIWRQGIADALSERLRPGQQLGIIKALTIGDRQDINHDQWQVFSKTGTGHLIAISGLHIGLVAGLVYFLTLKCWAWTGILRWSPARIAAPSALAAAFIYAALAGFSIPTQRALIMSVVVMAGIFFQRNVSPVNTLAIAIFSVCLIDPLAVLSPGFWLSFLAVTIIIFSLSGRVGQLNYWRSLIKIQWVAAVGLAPLVIFFFRQVSIISPLANLIAVPLVSLVIVPLSLLAVLFLYIWPSCSALLFSLLDIMLSELLKGLSALSTWSFAELGSSGASIEGLLLALAGCFMLLAPKGFPGRWLGLVLFLPLAFVQSESFSQGVVKLTLLDVGQGLSAAIQTNQHVLIFDTGAKFSDQYDMGSQVLLPFLHAQNIQKVDRLVISHSDNDHIGGANSLMKGIAVGQVYSSVISPLKQYSPTLCSAGQSWRWDDVEFTMLAPGQTTYKGENNQSCVLRIATRYGAILLTGDIENETESWLVDTYAQQLQSEVLVAPHHGSKTSSILPFLLTVKPEYILIPAGYRNRFGFPHAEVLHNYWKIQAQWLNTAYSGALTVLIDEEGIKVSSFRETDGNFWHEKTRQD